MLGENIRLLREERNMTLSKLANLAGISPGYLSDIEKGNKKSPSLDILKELAKILNVDVAIFLKEDLNGAIGKEVTYEKLNEGYEKYNQIKEQAPDTYKVDNWKNNLDKMEGQEEKIKYLESIVDFADPKEAVQFLLKQPSIMGFGGFDVNKMSDDEVIEFANELLNQLKLLSYKYKK